MTISVKGLTVIPLNTIPRLRSAAAVALAAGGLACAAPTACAGDYVHLTFVSPPTDNVSGWSASTESHGQAYIATALARTSATATWNVGGGRGVFDPGENTVFRYTAPPNTSLKHLAVISELSGLTTGDWNTIVRDASHDLYDDVPSHNGALTIDTDVSGSWVELALQCGGPHSCHADPNAKHRLTGALAQITDGFAPTSGTPSGGLVEDARLTGTSNVLFPATDVGSGLYSTRVLENDTVLSESGVDANDGHCVSIGWRKFDRAVPCLLSATASVSLDTTKLADGYHQLRVVVDDASGNVAQVWTARKLVANHPPVNTAVPAIPTADVNAQLFSAPRPGATITFPSGGAWTGPDLTKSVAWVRCDERGEGCVQIPGATALAYTPTDADLDHTLKLASTATNVAGTVTVYSERSGQVAKPKSAGDLVDKPATPAPAATTPASVVTPPGLTTNTTNNTSSSSTSHTVIGHIVGEPAGATCPGERATLRFEHVSGGRTRLGYGHAGTAQLVLACTTTGKAIADAKLDIAAKTGARPAVAADVTTDGAGHAVIRLAKGASRGITVGYRMYSDDALARATATLKVLVNARVSIRANRKRLHNGQAVTLRGALSGDLVPTRGVNLAVQWRDRGRWRPFAQIKTNKKGKYAYAYRFTRTARPVHYRLRVQIASGQVDYPYVATSSKSVQVTVGR